MLSFILPRSLSHCWLAGWLPVCKAHYCTVCMYDTGRSAQYCICKLHHRFQHEYRPSVFRGSIPPDLKIIQIENETFLSEFYTEGRPAQNLLSISLSIWFVTHIGWSISLHHDDVSQGYVFVYSPLQKRPKNTFP